MKTSRTKMKEALAFMNVEETCHACGGYGTEAVDVHFSPHREDYFVHHQRGLDPTITMSVPGTATLCGECCGVVLWGADQDWWLHWDGRFMRRNLRRDDLKTADQILGR